MEIIVKREDIPGGIKFTTKDCEYPRHFASTIRQALLLDGLDENTVDAIFGKTPNTVCAKTYSHNKSVNFPKEFVHEIEIQRHAESLGLIPIGEPIEEKEEEWEVPKSILTVDCENLSEHTRHPWYKKMVREMESAALDGRKFVLVYGAERTCLYIKERGLVIEPWNRGMYMVSPLDSCNSIVDIANNPKCKAFESLADALNFAM